MIFPYGETVTVLRATLTDDGYGNQVYDWATAASSGYARCAVAQGMQGGQGVQSSEFVVDRNAIISDRIVFMPADTDVRATDRLEIRGDVFEVVGEPFGWTSPFTGTSFGTVVYCNRVEG